MGVDPDGGKESGEKDDIGVNFKWHSRDIIPLEVKGRVFSAGVVGCARKQAI